MRDMNGSDFFAGSILGQILASNHEQIRLNAAHTEELIRVRETLEDLPERIAAAIPKPPSLLDRLGLSLRQLVALIITGSMALAGALDGADIKAILLAQLGIEQSSGTP